MAGFRRDTPIDPMHEAGICRWLAEHHDRKVAETEGEDRADHQRAAKSCRDHAAEWEAKAAEQSAPARPAVTTPKVEAAPCKPTPVVYHAPPPVQHKPKPKPAQPQPPKVAAGQGALF